MKRSKKLITIALVLMICFAVASPALATTWYGDAGTASLSFEAGGLQWRVTGTTTQNFVMTGVIAIYNSSGRWVDDIPVSGTAHSPSGTISGFVSVSHLPSGRYDAVLTGGFFSFDWILFGSIGPCETSFWK